MEETAENKARRDRALDGILEAVNVLVSAPDTDTLLRRLLEREVSIMAADAGAVLLYDETSRKLVVRQVTGVPFERPVGAGVPLGEGLAGRVAAESRPVSVRNVQQDPGLRMPGVRFRGIKSIIGVPLLVEGRLVGVMHLDYRSEFDFTPDDVRRLEAVAACTAAAVESSRQRELERRRLIQLSALQEVSAAIGTSLDLGEICQRAIVAVLHVVSGQAGVIYAVDRTARTLRAISWVGVTEEFIKEFALMPLNRDSLTGRAVLTGAPQFGARQRLPSIGKRVVAKLKTRNYVAVPIASAGKVVGTLNIILDPGRPVTEEEVELLRTITGPIGISMENACLHQRATRLNDELKATTVRLQALLNASQYLQARLEVPQLLRAIVERAAGIIQATAGLAALRKEDTLVAREWWNGKKWLRHEFIWRKGEGGPGWVWATGRAYVSNDVPNDPHTMPEIKALMRLRNFIVAPLTTIDGRLLGVIQLDNKAEGQPFSEEDRRMVEDFSRIASVALQNAQLFEEMMSSRRILRSIVDNVPFEIVYLNPDLRVQWVNPATVSLWGFAPDETTGRSLFQIVPWLRAHPAAGLLRGAVRDRETKTAAEVAISPPGKKPEFWDVSVVPVKDASGKVQGLFCLAVPVTERVQTRQRIEQWALREKAVGEVALAVNSGARCEEVLTTATERVVSVLGAEMGAIFMGHPEAQYITGAASYGVRGLKIEGLFIPLDQTPRLRKALLRKRAEYITLEQAAALGRRYLNTLGLGALLAVPLVAVGKVIGVLLVGSRKRAEAPTVENVAFAKDLANQCAIAIEKARLMDELRMERERLQTIIGEMPSGVVIAEAAKGRISLVNRGTEEIFGRVLPVGTKIEEISRLLGLRHPDGRPLLPEELVLARSLRERKPVRGLEAVVARPNGTARHVIASSQPIYDRKGNVREVVLVLQDVTSLKQAQQRAEEAAAEAAHRAAELDALMRSMTEGILIADRTGRIVFVNDVGRELWQLPATPSGECRPEQYKRLDLRYPDGRPLPFEEWPINRALRGERFTGQEVLYVRADGRRLFLSFSGSAVLNARGVVRMAINVYHDVTRLRELERQREDYVRAIAHDLKSPLTIVLGQAQMAEHYARTGEASKVLDSARAIITGAKRMDVMIRDLSDAARMEVGKLELSKRPVDLVAFVRDLRERMAATVDLSRIRVVATKPVPRVLADEDRLERILMNLLTNALKYSPPDSLVTIRMLARDGEVLTSVTDKGVGIAPEDMPHVFQRFFRAKGVRKTEGLGLGLYITRILVEAHGGRIWVKSKPGKGSTFYFTLPVAPSGPVGTPRPDGRQ